jgi:tryptophanyl-tRNA synthetase
MAILNKLYNLILIFCNAGNAYSGLLMASINTIIANALYRFFGVLRDTSWNYIYPRMPSFVNYTQHLKTIRASKERLGRTMIPSLLEEQHCLNPHNGIMLGMCMFSWCVIAAIISLVFASYEYMALGFIEDGVWWFNLCLNYASIYSGLFCVIAGYHHVGNYISNIQHFFCLAVSSLALTGWMPEWFPFVSLGILGESLYIILRIGVVEYLCGQGLIRSFLHEYEPSSLLKINYHRQALTFMFFGVMQSCRKLVHWYIELFRLRILTVIFGFAQHAQKFITNVLPKHLQKCLSTIPSGSIVEQRFDTIIFFLNPMATAASFFIRRVLLDASLIHRLQYKTQHLNLQERSIAKIVATRMFTKAIVSLLTYMPLLILVAYIVIYPLTSLLLNIRSAEVLHTYIMPQIVMITGQCLLSEILDILCLPAVLLNMNFFQYIFPLFLLPFAMCGNFLLNQLNNFVILSSPGNVSSIAIWINQIFNQHPWASYLFSKIVNIYYGINTTLQSTAEQLKLLLFSNKALSAWVTNSGILERLNTEYLLMNISYINMFFNAIKFIELALLLVAFKRIGLFSLAAKDTQTIIYTAGFATVHVGALMFVQNIIRIFTDPISTMGSIIAFVCSILTIVLLNMYPPKIMGFRRCRNYLIKYWSSICGHERYGVAENLLHETYFCDSINTPCVPLGQAGATLIKFQKLIAKQSEQSVNQDIVLKKNINNEPRGGDTYNGSGDSINDSSKGVSGLNAQSNPFNITNASFAGIRPTGRGLHIGNIAMLLIAKPDIIMIADDYEDKNLLTDTTTIFKQISALLPKAQIFTQSSSEQSIRLMWLLAQRIGVAELLKNVNSKIIMNSDRSQPLSKFLYPLLMASDIILYNPKKVLVGADQTINIETYTHIKTKLAHLCPNLALISEPSLYNIKIKNLAAPEEKMSKSALSHLQSGVLYLSDDSNIVEYKINKAITSNSLIGDIDADTASSKNLLEIMSILTGVSVPEVVIKYHGFQWSAFKPILAHTINEFFKKINNKMLSIEGSLLISNNNIMSNYADFRIQTLQQSFIKK